MFSCINKFDPIYELYIMDTESRFKIICRVGHFHCDQNMNGHSPLPNMIPILILIPSATTNTFSIATRDVTDSILVLVQQIDPGQNFSHRLKGNLTEPLKKRMCEMCWKK